MLFPFQLPLRKEFNQSSLVQLWNANKKRWQPKSLIPSTIAYGIILAVGTTAIGTYGIVRNLILENLKENALLKVEKSASEIDEWLASLQSEVETIANNSAVRSMQWSVAEPFLQIELARLSDYYIFSIIRPDGSYYTTKTGLVKGKNLRDRRHFQEGMSGKTYVSDLLISRATGVRQINVVAPIWSVPAIHKNHITQIYSPIPTQSLKALNIRSDPLQKPQTIGVLTGQVPIDHVTKVVTEIYHGKGSYAFVLDSQGVPIAYPDRRILQEAKTLLNHPDRKLAKIYQEMVNHQQNIDKVEIDRQLYYIAYTAIGRANWSIALAIPVENLESKLAPLNILASGIAIILILATAIAIRQLQLLNQTRQKADEEEMINGITARIRESLEIETILQTTVDEVATLLKLDVVSFCWYRPDARELEIICENSRNKVCENWELRKIKHITNVIDRCNRLEIICINDVKDIIIDRRIYQNNLLPSIQSFLALPVQVQNHSPGYLFAIRSKPWIWSDREKNLLYNVSEQLAIAIEQSRLLAQTSEQVTILSQQAKQLKQTLAELQKTQTQLIQSEKMSSLGQLVAGMAHEINNPVSFIYGNLSHADEYTQHLIEVVQLYQKYYPQATPEIEEKIEEVDLNFAIEDLPNLLKSMKSGADRIRQIIISLRNFSRFDEAELKLVNIHEGIDSALMIIQHRLNFQTKGTNRENPPRNVRIQIVKQYGNLPLVYCYAGQLNQVLMNILNNGIDALEELPSQNPTILICTEVVDKERIAIRIKDNGKGMTKEIQQRLFDPFFTTKPVGKGTGLGLSIAYQIVVEKHGGSLHCITEPEQGTEFVIEIPIKQKFTP